MIIKQNEFAITCGSRTIHGEITPVSWTEICYNEMGVLLYEIFDERKIKDS